MASSVEALAEAFEGTLRELRRLRRHIKGASKPSSTDPTKDENHFKVKFGKIGSFQYAPAQVVWNEVHPAICAEDQLAQSPLVKSLRPKFGAVNFSIRWCQVDASQQKCLCFNIDIKYENELPFSLPKGSNVAHRTTFATNDNVSPKRCRLNPTMSFLSQNHRTFKFIFSI